MIRIDIISDPVCPWCYIGKAHLDRALAEAPGHMFAIRWRPYQLNPDLPPEGMDRAAYLEAKFGGAQGARAVYSRIADAAREAGLDLRFDRIARAPNTLDAHRLIHWAAAEGVQTAVVEELFRRYHVEGDDISDPRVLQEAGERAGMDGAAVARLLAGDADRAELRAEIEAAREMGVTGVPTFILAERYVLTGAQPAETWTRIFTEIASTHAVEAPVRH